MSNKDKEIPEEVNVVAWLGEYEDVDGSHFFNAVVCERSMRRCPPDFGEPVPLMTVDQHKRILEDLRKRADKIEEAAQ